MTNESWQTICQIVVAIGLVLAALGGGLAALGGLGAYFFGQRIEHEKKVHSAYAGKIESKDRVIFSVAQQITPKLEGGDSGAIFDFTEHQGVITFFRDAHLTIVTEDNQVKLSTVVRDRTGEVIAELQKNEWKINPNKSLDRNYTRDALEVKDASGQIILQVKVLTDRVQLQIKGFDSSGQPFALAKIYGPKGWGLGIFKEHPEQLKFEPMFRYPSDSHLAEFVQSPLRS